MTETEEYTLCYKLLDESQKYVLGFELGQLHTQLENEKGRFERHQIHSGNKKQVELLCNYFEVGFTFEETADPDWLILILQ